MTANRFAFSREGRWSGGGRAFLDNASFAEELHPILRGGPDATPIIARNVPANRWQRQPYLAMPQNAWPWFPHTLGIPERSKLLVLRVMSERFCRRAQSVMRIGNAIPKFPTDSGEVLPNVLDRGYEQALSDSHKLSVKDLPKSYFVSLGSMNTYRNFEVVIDAYRAYRANGGGHGLVIGGPPSNPAIAATIRKATDGLPDVVVRAESLSRAECLTMMRAAEGVVLPSKVEASPMSLLEALSVSSAVAASDIFGHRDPLPIGAALSDSSYFAPDDAGTLAEWMYAPPRSSNANSILSDAEMRTQMRVEWADGVASWVTRVASEMSTSRRE